MSPDKLDYVVGVHAGIPMLHLLTTFPAHNKPGAILLCRLLESALIREGLTIGGECALKGAELNDCVFLARVVDAERAAQVIQQELSAAFLLSLCQIGICEDSGWRCTYPSPAVKLQWLMDGEQIEGAAVQFSQIAANQIKSLREIAGHLRRSVGGEGSSK